MTNEIRQGTPADSQGIFEVVTAAFDIAPDSLRMPRARAMADNVPHEFRVMIRDGRVAAVVHVADTWIQVGECAVLKGDVGHVSVQPELQGQGLGTALLQDVVQWMRGSGYHMSRLGGLMRFYRRFGYEPFLRRFVEFEVPEFSHTRGRVPALEAHPEPSGFEGVLRPYDEARDWRARHEIRHVFYHGRSGAERVPAEAQGPASPTPPDPDLMRWVYELGGEVKGYLFAAISPLEARGDETCISLSDFAYRPDCPQAAGLLLKQLLARAAHVAPARITSRLPFDEPLAEALQAGGVEFRRIELYQAVAGNMIQVLNLHALLEAIAPELQERLARSPVAGWTGGIELSLPSERCLLTLAGGKVIVAEAGAADLRLEMTQAQFVKALLGINAFAELPCSRGLDAGELALMGALFPRTQTGSGPWG